METAPYFCMSKFVVTSLKNIRTHEIKKFFPWDFKIFNC